MISHLTWKLKIDKLARRRDHVLESLKEEKVKLRKAKRLQATIEDAQTVARTVASSLQQDVHARISGLVTTCLETVFGDEYQFRILFEEKRNRTEAKLILIKDGHEIHDPLNEDSGGVADVAALALRVTSILMSKPHVRPLIVLDEPFKFVSAEYRPILATMLEKLAEDLGIQIIMVTHDTEYQIGKVVHLW